MRAARLRMTAGLVTSSLVAACLAAALVPAPAAAASYDATVLSLVNAARAAHGVPALTWASGTSQVAAAWAAHLAATRALAHNPDLAAELETHGSPDWTTYGENVGSATVGDPVAMVDAYLASPVHRANILDPSYHYIGIGTVDAGGRSWNTLDFVDSYRGVAPAPSPSPTRVAPAPTASPPARVAPTHIAPARAASTRRPQRHEPRAASRAGARAPLSAHRLEAAGGRPARADRASLSATLVAGPGAISAPGRPGRGGMGVVGAAVWSAILLALAALALAGRRTSGLALRGRRDG